MDFQCFLENSCRDDSRTRPEESFLTPHPSIVNNAHTHIHQIHGHVLVPKSSHSKEKVEEKEEVASTGWFGFGGGDKEKKREKDLVERIRDRNSKRSKDMIVVLNTGPIDVRIQPSKAVEVTCTTDSELPSTYEGQHASCRYFVSLKRKGESSFKHRQIFCSNLPLQTDASFQDDPILSKLKLVEKHRIEPKRDVAEKRFNLKRRDGSVLAKLSFQEDNHDDSYVSGVITLQEKRDEKDCNVQLEALRTETVLHESKTTTTEIIESLTLETSRALVLPFRLSYCERRAFSRPVETNLYVSKWSLRLRFSNMLEWTFPVDIAVEKEKVFERKSSVSVSCCDSVSLDGDAWDDHLMF